MPRFKGGCSSTVSESPQLRQTASAANRPLITAPSIVAGQPVRTQSPAKLKVGNGESAVGRTRSAPGETEKTEWGSVTTRDRNKLAERASGNATRSSSTTAATSWSLLASLSACLPLMTT